MAEEGYFIVNGVERVIITQIIKSPSVYFDSVINTKGKKMVSATLHSPRGTRLSVEEANGDVLKVIINQKSKISASVFLKGCGFSDEQILKMFANDPLIESTISKDIAITEDEALLEIGRKTRPSDIPMAEKVKEYLKETYFSNTHYNFSRVGRYKYNKKLSRSNRLIGMVAAEDVVKGKKVFAKTGETITKEVAIDIQDSGINEVLVQLNDGAKYNVIGNARVKLSKVFPCKEEELGINELVYYPLLEEILKQNKTKEERIEAIKQNAKELITTHLTIEDIIATISYVLGLKQGVGSEDNIDHLANRRVATVGELICNEFRKGVAKLKETIRENLQSHDLTELTPANLISARPINKYLKDFLASGQLSQITEDFNPAASLTNKRRVSAVGPGGIKAERAQGEARDIHYSHYGRICAIETPEGPKIGLINGLATYARVNEYGFIETPYRRIDKQLEKVTDEIVYMMADEEEKYNICQAIELLNEDKTFVNKKVLCRHIDQVLQLPINQVDFMDVSPRQFISAQTSLIPFLENDDTVRALTGSNMQRQAVPLLQAEAPIVGTGMEHYIARDSGAMIHAERAGVVEFADAKQIRILEKDGQIKEYNLLKFQKTNKETCFNQKPLVKKGQKVKEGEVIADGYSTKDGELAIGKNLAVAFMNWEGYNYEDAILISERLVKDDTLTSIVLKTEDCVARSTKLGDEEITRDIPNVSEEMLRNLDENGIIRVGAEVKAGDYLVGKVTPKGETELTPEERLLRAIFGEKAREVRDNSLKVPHGSGGIVVDVQIFTKKNRDELDPGVNTLVKVYIAKKRRISVGDKMAGRHGNKGVISRVLPESDMPYMPNGQPVDVVLNPLGVPSRMNIGQVLEVHLGLIAKTLGWKVATPTFNGASEQDILQLFKESGLPEDGKMELFDGRTGEMFENRVTMGYMYMIKLEHMAESKVHARSIGSYALVTRQPLGGKAMFGGQRFGEMEVWALEAYGASHLLQEMLTVKSDDLAGRTKAYEAIVKGEPMSEPGVPEAFRVLVKEFQSIGLDIKILTEDNKELSVNEITAEEEVLGLSNSIDQELKDISLGLEEDLQNFTLENEFENAGIEDLFDDEDMFE
ncbi:MAG: DNA-directed RNA polymerase subunit beta [Tenericutes bacterium HGW-Tenericutes-4]|nr:MAG: DNA-directed RNA polymerase subunit beta [Tenericutes bacterium HGW-Tenericutes-4]